jgi:hypothetical protein
MPKEAHEFSDSDSIDSNTVINIIYRAMENKARDFNMVFIFNFISIKDERVIIF